MSGIYQGEKHCEILHDPSGSRLSTDAPKDNNGRGEAFSPTDLVGAALASCALTTIAIFAEKEGKDVKSSSFTVTKEMSSQPRKIARLSVQRRLPKSFSIEDRQKFEKIARHCPVALSLHPEVEIPMEFHWDL